MAHKLAMEDKQFAEIYCDQVVKARIAQKMRSTIRGGDANESIFVAKLVRTIYNRKESSLH